MKAKFYTVILSTLLLAGFTAKAQVADNRNFRNDEAGIVINNYYDDYDYYYSSRINRFHRDYAAFDYYSPVFTETYWYNYQPYSWGISIYGRSGLGFGFAVNYPVYYYGWGTDYWYNYNFGWYDPYYGSSGYWGYDPFYYSWYSPVAININIGPRWRNNYWFGRGFWHNDYRPVYHVSNNYYYNEYAVRNSYRSMPDHNRQGEYNRSTAGASRRESVPAAGTRSQPVNRSSEGQVNISQGGRPADMRPSNSNRGNSGNTGNKINNASNTDNNNGNTRNNGNNVNNANNGNNRNSRPGGNNGNFNQNSRNTNNNGNNNNSRPNGNNGNFGNKSGNASPAARSSSGSGRSYSAPSRSSSSKRSETTRSSSSSKSSSKSSSGSKSGDDKSKSSRR
jgi:hypothetical protein